MKSILISILFSLFFKFSNGQTFCINENKFNPRIGYGFNSKDQKSKFLNDIIWKDLIDKQIQTREDYLFDLFTIVKAYLENVNESNDLLNPLIKELKDKTRQSLAPLNLPAEPVYLEHHWNTSETVSDKGMSEQIQLFGLPFTTPLKIRVHYVITPNSNPNRSNYWYAFELIVDGISIPSTKKETTEFSPIIYDYVYVLNERPPKGEISFQLNNLRSTVPIGDVGWIIDGQSTITVLK